MTGTTSPLAGIARQVGVDLARHAGVITALIGVIVLGTIGSNVFLTTSNLSIVAQQVAGIGVIAAGTTVLMIAGGLDLSIGASVGVASICVAKWLNGGMSAPQAVALTVALTTGFGLVLGLIITVTKAQAFMVTLGGMSILQGVGVYLTPNGAVPINSGFTALGVDRIWGNVPIGFVVMIVVLLMTYALLHRFRIGRAAFAIGNNITAARLAGIRVDLTNIVLYAFNGALVGLGACILTSAVGTGGADVGVNLALQLVAAVVIGGASLAGGQGSVFGTFLGVVLIGMLTNALNLIGVGSYLQFVAFGVITIAAVGIRSSSWSLPGWKRQWSRRGSENQSGDLLDLTSPREVDKGDGAPQFDASQGAIDIREQKAPLG